MKKTILATLFFLTSVFAASAQITMGAERTELYFDQLEGKKIAVCGNQSSRVGNSHLVDTLVASGFNVVTIFCPEHGFRGNAEAGAHINSSVDEKTGIPIVSLYGKNKKPDLSQHNIDLIIFDIQDVGCRFYTYISTLHYVMEAAAENDVEVMILDRPNPNGYFVDGPVLDTNLRSFVGMHPIPVVHGMTIGEYGRMINGEQWLANGVQCKLQVVPMDNYDHNTRYNLPIAPSPNLQTEEAIYLYPSLCLFEGTPISIGRGTKTPFQVYGHPQLTVGDYFFTPMPIKGVSENPPQKGLQCRGYNLTAIASEQINKNNCFNISYLLDAYKHFPDKAKFFNANLFFDKLAGTRQLRKDIIAGKSEQEIRVSWEPQLQAFKEKRQMYLLYPDFE
ncbi:MAG: DUF1343 domain-containing protein [Bacteroidales bacterium]|nr:DUF1343 domain-containing protein [Bacteroidales bacterium]